MKHIVFKYRDELSYPKWNIQECIVCSIQECIKLYGLNECEYEIISVKEV